MTHSNGANGVHAPNGATAPNGLSAWNGAGTHGAVQPLDLERLFEGKRLIVVGGTGYLGKTWWSFLLAHWPKVGHLYLLVREKSGMSAEERFWREIVPTAVFDPLRTAYGAHFEQFLREKVTPVAGDVVRPFCGLGPTLREDLRGTIDVVVNAAGVVDFDPPLDEALEVNAFGVQNLVALAKDLGDRPLLHTSTCYVAGSRTGHIHESSPLEFPFPRADELERGHWVPDREIAECLDVIEQARHRGNDAFRQSRFLDEAKKNLAERGEPARGRVLETEIGKVKRKFVEARLAETGMERAQFWGFPNTYTYTKAIGEQIVARSGLAFTIVRPAIVESSLRYPFPGWNEGINTSAPLIYILREGGLQIPGSEHYLDFIPVDLVAGGMCAALAELLDGTAKAVYQLGSTDTNPCTMRRFFELTGLYKRKYYQRTLRGGPLFAYLQSHFEGALLNRPQFESYGPKKLAGGAKTLAGVLDKAAVGPARAFLAPASDAMRKFARQQERVGKVLEVFVPFTVDYHYVFRCDHVRAACARMPPADARRIAWAPEAIDWRSWFFDVHMPGLEKWVFPQIDEKVKRKRRAPERHETLTALLDEMATRFDLAVALQRAEPDGLTRLSFRQWRERALACAARLAELGVKPGDRVAVAAQNHPAWPLAFFGILCAGATVVPLDSGIDLDAARALVEASGARVFLGDVESRGRLALGLGDRVAFVDIRKIVEAGPLAELAPVEPTDVAALIYTSGTTGKPKGVALSHQNLTALVASLAPLFPLDKADRVLSVLPLHHTFELTCGMLLPLSRGARIVYLDELNAERLEHALAAGRITGLIGVPALWEMLERRILSRVAERGALFSHVFDFAVELNRSLGKTLGMDAGRALFGPVHQGLGGHLRFLVSGGAALPERTHHLFAGLGLHLAEGYGLTEASPVLTVAEAGPKARSGHVGRAIPGVEIRIASPNAEGVGEVLARGPNVMLGYSDDPEATRQVIDADGWLHTGDLGKLDRRGHLVIAGRAKDVIVASNGENVYPDDVEARLGRVEHLKELAVIGLPDGRGGERVACIAVPEEDAAVTRAERHTRARQALDASIATLPPSQRPALVTLFDTPLPRTATRKVKRAELRRQVERLLQASEPPPSARSSAKDVAAQSVRGAVATIARRDAATLGPELSLRGDLAFDSLMLLELLVALETQHGRSLDAERINAAQTIGDVEALLRQHAETRRPVATTTIVDIERESVEVPEPLREAAMHWLGRAQHGFYDRVLETKVLGRAHIPYNRNVIVAANHASHLDMGLVKYALGSYGTELVSLAAQDYFFEGNRFLTAYFENFTRLVPMPRNGTLRQGLRKAGELLEQGKTVLLFPEGTRSTDGQVHEFKAIIGHLALHHGVDVLPIYLGGTHGALPKGAKVVRRRDVEARIGPVLEARELERLTAGLSAGEASRKATRFIEEAVRALGRGSFFDIRGLAAETAAAPEPPPPPTLQAVFQELEKRFAPGAVERPTSYYFSLGDDRFTLIVSKERCEVKEGKHVAAADCVLKTSPDLFARIVREAYVPSPAEFMSGAVKTNNVGLLLEFQKAFRLLERARGAEGQ